MEDIFSEISVPELNYQNVEQTITLRRASKMKTPDAIIASTALVFNLTLITRNTSDFNNIQGLRVVDPHALRIYGRI